MFRSGKAYHQISSDVELSTSFSSKPKHDVVTPQPSWRQRHFKGWRVGVLSGASLATTVLLVNLIVTVVASSTHEEIDSGRRLLFEGDCAKAEKLNILAHLLINALSTILLSASNYGMQALSAPTREEVDVAHAKRRWLDIGVLSVRNIQSINPKRALLWAGLGLSSLPLHLLYNSAVFQTITANEYIIFSARSDMLEDSTLSSAFISAQGDTYVSEATAMFDKVFNGTLERLTGAQCIDAYALTFQTQRGSLILVTNDTQKLPTAREYSDYDASISPQSILCLGDPFDWICSQDAEHTCMDQNDTPCSATYKKLHGDNWAPLGNLVDHCLSEKLPGHCKVQFSTSIAAVVIVFNAFKAAILASIFFFVKEDPLLTMGDAVASFLKSTDETTKALCLMSRDKLALWKMPPVPQPYAVGTKRSRRWSNIVSRSRWWFCMLLYAVAILTCFSLLIFGITGKTVSAGTLITLPLGSLNPSTFIFGWNVPTSGNSGVTGNVLVANSPQVILSTIYYTYNSIFTAFLAGQEWSDYAVQRKGLRVSRVPSGQQRSTYFLQLPYKVALPLMVLSGVLHWLTSQSIFLASIEVMSSDNADFSSIEFLTCGYSPPAILAVVLLGLFMVAVVTFFGRRQFKGGMPIVATCSASISAMCHLPEAEKDAGTERRPVLWGISAENVDMYDKKHPVSHCSFSSLHVRLPEEGELCA